MNNLSGKEMKKEMHPNHYQPYTSEQLSYLEEVAKGFQNRSDLEREAKRIGAEWGRTWGAIANKLEVMTGKRKDPKKNG